MGLLVGSQYSLVACSALLASLMRSAALHRAPLYSLVRLLSHSHARGKVAILGFCVLDFSAHLIHFICPFEVVDLGLSVGNECGVFEHICFSGGRGREFEYEITKHA